LLFYIIKRSLSLSLSLSGFLLLFLTIMKNGISLSRSTITVHIQMGIERYYFFQDFGRGNPLINDLNSWRATLGLKSGTSWPAPLTVANVSPSYTSVHPPTFRKHTTHIIEITWQLYSRILSHQIRGRLENDYLLLNIPRVPRNFGF
jgi:hypothetical protein